jgi:hypothetical protein
MMSSESGEEALLQQPPEAALEGAFAAPASPSGYCEELADEASASKG